MNATFTDFLWLAEHTVAIINETLPEFFDTIELSGRLHEIAVSTENQDLANIMDAAAMRLLELMEDNDRLNERLRCA